MSAFRVIIVGGGLGGLTFANCLQHAGIDYLLLEGREKIGLHVGAAVGIEPHGGRILDQLGVLSSLHEAIEPYRSFVFRDTQGKFQWSTDAPELVEVRTGYPAFVHDRQFILQTLYHHLWDKKKVLLNKRVQHVEHSRDSVKVICQDGTEHVGQIVVGSDGVNSVIRKEMWRLSDLEEPGRIPQSQKEFLTANYRGLYGISTAIKGIETGNMTIISNKDQVCYWACSKAGRINWCLVEKLDRQYQAPHVPKYTSEDVQEYAMRSVNKQLVSDTADVKFGDFWDRRQRWALVALEEGHLDHWSWGRIVCIGDSVHKFTPESGQGANQAIETAAALANHLERLLHNCSGKLPDLAAVQNCLTSFEAKRQRRSRPVVEQTNQHVRLFTYSNPLFRFLSKYVQPIFHDIAANMANQRHIGAERLEFLAIPSQSLSGIMTFNPTQGIGLFESLSSRALFGLPLLVIGFLGSWWTKQKLLHPLMQPVGVSGELDLTNRSSALVLGRLLSVQSWPDLLIIGDTQLADQNQLGLLLVDVAPVYLIWLMEANRRANYLKPIQITLLFGLLAQTGRFGLWANIWFFLHYLQAPIEIFAASDQRLLNMNYARALLPTVLFGYAAPLLAMALYPSHTVCEHLASIQPFFPVLVSIVHNLFARAIQDTTKQDRLCNVKADLPSLRRACLVVGIASAATLQYFRYRTGNFGWLHNVRFAGTLHQQTFPALTAGIFNRENFDLYSGALLWLGLIFGDLKKAGMLKTSWMWLVLCVAACTAIIGPGATLLAGWAWREEVLSSKRH